MSIDGVIRKKFKKKSSGQKERFDKLNAEYRKVCATAEKVEGQVGNPVRRSNARSARYKIHVVTLTLYHVTIPAFFIKIVDVKLALSLHLKESEVV